MELYDKWIWTLIEQAKNVSLTDDLLDSVHVSVGKLLRRNSPVFLCVHHDFALMDYLHSKQPSIGLVSNEQDFGKCSLPQYLE